MHYILSSRTEMHHAECTMKNLLLANRIEAAEALRISPRTLDYAVASGKLGCVRIGEKRGRVLFRQCDLDSFIARNTRPARQDIGAINSTNL